MALDIYFPEDITNRLEALAQANERALKWAEQLGANPRGIALVRAAYQGALVDVSTAFGLAARVELVMLPGEVSHSDIPIALNVASLEKDGARLPETE